MAGREAVRSRHAGVLGDTVTASKAGGLHVVEYVAVVGGRDVAGSEQFHDGQPDGYDDAGREYVCGSRAGRVAGTLKGTGETLIDSVSTSATLSLGSLVVTGAPTLSLSGFTTANLTDTSTGGNTFTVSGWTKNGSLLDTGTVADTVTASKNAGYTLTNSLLTSTDGMSLALVNVGTANLTDAGSSHTFAITVGRVAGHSRAARRR